jgi:nucleoside-diphosphate-sugar epimerase
MKILITGATGFIGSHVTRIFLDQNAEIAIFVRNSKNLKALKPFQNHLKIYSVRAHRFSTGDSHPSCMVCSPRRLSHKSLKF